MFTPFSRKSKKTNPGDFHKNPLFYFGLLSVVLLGLASFGSDSLAELNNHSGLSALMAFSTTASSDNGDLYVNQNSAKALETPDLKILQDNFVYGVSAPHVVSTQTLGAIMGGQDFTQTRTSVEDITVEVGDSPQSIADKYGLSLNTVLWANDLSKNSILKIGESLVILPVDGALYIVKSGDVIGTIAKTHKAKTEDIIAFNNLSGEGDIFIGDILIIPGGAVPSKASISNSIGGQNVLPDSFFIYPLLKFTITQGLHYFNAIDIASQCGDSVYAAAKGTVQRAVANGGWNFGMGNYVTVLHSNGVSTYYGHLMSVLVKPGDEVNVGDRIGLEGKTGESTGCHVHFQVMGAANPLAKYKVGSVLK